MSGESAGRFSLFSDKEKAMISLGLVLSLLDATHGLVSAPLPRDLVADRIELISALVSEIGEGFGLDPINPSILGPALERLRSQV